MSLQLLANLIYLGVFYGALAAGFSLIWGVLNILNLAYGAFIVLGAYATYYAYSVFHIDPFLFVPIAMALMFAFGYLVHVGLIDRLRDERIFTILVLTFGLQLLIVNVANLTFKADFRSITLPYTGAGFYAGGVSIPYTWLAETAWALAFVGGLTLLIGRTWLGRAIRAVALDKNAARMCGIDVRRVFALTFGIGSAIAGGVGSLFIVTSSVNPESGGALTLDAAVIAAFGGLGSTLAAIVGGIALATVETLASVFLGPSYRSLAAFALLIITLALRPQGLMGRRYFAQIEH